MWKPTCEVLCILLKYYTSTSGPTSHLQLLWSVKTCLWMERLNGRPSSPAANLNWPFFLLRRGEKSDRQWRGEGGREGQVGNIQRLTFFYLPRRSLTWETRTWDRGPTADCSKVALFSSSKGSPSRRCRHREGGRKRLQSPPLFLRHLREFMLVLKSLVFWPLWLVFISQKK